MEKEKRKQFVIVYSNVSQMYLIKTASYFWKIINVSKVSTVPRPQCKKLWSRKLTSWHVSNSKVV